MKRGPFMPVNHPKAGAFGASPTLGTGFPPRKASTDYDAGWAYALSVIAGWSYAEGQVLADQIQFHGFPNCSVEQISVENNALLIVATAFFIRAVNGRVGVLAFRGTEPTSLINWLTDADTTMYAFGKGHVHEGFFANTEAIWSDIVDVVGAAVDAGLEELYVAGHSLGGAMAVVAAARIFADPRLSEWQKRVRGIYTFGQPMVGDEGFRTDSRSFDKFLFRHVYGHDVVPFLPPAEVGKFVHFGEKRVAERRDDIWNVSKKPDEPAPLLAVLAVVESFFTRRIAALRAVSVDYSLDDHSPRGYIDVSRNSLVPDRPRPVRLERSHLRWLEYGRAWMRSVAKLR